MKSLKAIATVGVLILAGSAGAQAQTERKAAPIIGVAIESSDGRVKNWAPELRAQAARVVEQSAKNARVIILGVTGRDIADAAQKNGVDYLMTIEISPRPYGELSIGGPGILDPEVSGHPRANAQGTIFLSWTVQALNGKPFKLHDSRMVQAQEYPLDPNFDWLHVIASRSVRDAAAAATGKLKKKAGW
jgi:hypothetical protein